MRYFVSDPIAGLRHDRETIAPIEHLIKRQHHLVSIIFSGVVTLLILLFAIIASYFAIQRAYQNYHKKHQASFVLLEGTFKAQHPLSLLF